MTNTTTRHRGPNLNWKPQKKTLVLLNQIDKVLDEYAAHLPLTARQVYYRLVATRNYAKTENAYARLCETLVDARRAGRIDFAHIRDDGVRMQQRLQFDDPTNFWRYVRQLAEEYCRNSLRHQEQAVEVWAEAAGMVPQLAAVADKWGVAVLSSSGFDSVTAKYDAACRARDDGRRLVVLHIGDLDPSGVHLFDAANEDVTAWGDYLGGDVTFQRVAITLEQVLTYELPTAPPKTTDRRAFSGETCQAEALPPDVLARLLDDALSEVLDPVIRQNVEATEGDERAVILTTLDTLVEPWGE